MNEIEKQKQQNQLQNKQRNKLLMSVKSNHECPSLQCGIQRDTSARHIN